MEQELQLSVETTMESIPSSVHVSNHANYSTPEIESTGIEEIDNGEYWTLSGKPYVDMIVTKTTVKPFYGMYLPRKMNKELPAAGAPAVLTCGRTKWDMFYYSNYNKFSAEWKKIVDDNDLKVGDGLVFELSECSTNKIHFKVQILRGDFPSELLPEDEEGATDANPIEL